MRLNRREFVAFSSAAAALGALPFRDPLLTPTQPPGAFGGNNSS